MADLTSLIERVEGGVGPDRELDALVWLAVTPGATRKATNVDHPKGAYTIDETRDPTGRLITVPAYTASLDAVVSLIEAKLPGAFADVDLGALPVDQKLYGARIFSRDENPWSNVAGEASSPARALLAATLRAIQESRNDR